MSDNSGKRPRTGAARAAADRARAAVDGWDVLLFGSAAALFAGLWLTFALGVALIVVGTLGLVLGLAGARGAELAALLEARRKEGSG